MSGREEKLGGIRRRNVGKVDEKEESKVSKKLAKFDVFYKVEESVVESKRSSRGFLSVLTIFSVAILTFNEISYHYFEHREKYHYSVDKSNDAKNVAVTFDIVVNTPCNQIGAGISNDANADIQSLSDIQAQPAYFKLDKDESRRYHALELEHSKERSKDVVLIDNPPRITYPPSFPDLPKPEAQKSKGMADPIGGLIGGRMGGFDPIFQMMESMAAMQQAQMVELSLPVYNKGEGTPDSCRFFGKTNLARVKGNLHITSGKKIAMAGGGMMQITVIGMNQKPMNFSHRINQLSFSFPGNEHHYHVQPLDGHQANTEMNHFQYFLNLVPVFLKSKGKKFYQYAVTETADNDRTRQFFGLGESEGIVFKYDFSAVLVEIERLENMAFSLFLVRLCSVVGGVISIASFFSKLF